MPSWQKCYSPNQMRNVIHEVITLSLEGNYSHPGLLPRQQLTPYPIEKKTVPEGIQYKLQPSLISSDKMNIQWNDSYYSPLNRNFLLWASNPTFLSVAWRNPHVEFHAHSNSIRAEQGKTWNNLDNIITFSTKIRVIISLFRCLLYFQHKSKIHSHHVYLKCSKHLLWCLERYSKLYK